MAMRCTVCDHPDSIEINRLLAEDIEPNRKIAEKYRLSKSALVRHAETHLPKILERAIARSAAKDEDQFLDSIQNLMSESAQYVKDAHGAVLVRCVGKNEYREYRDVGAMAAAINSARGVTELLGKATGRLQDAITERRPFILVLAPGATIAADTAPQQIESDELTIDVTAVLP